jgi:hypothetical protein
MKEEAGQMFWKNFLVPIEAHEPIADKIEIALDKIERGKKGYTQTEESK